MHKQLFFLASILCLIGCSNNQKTFERISDAKEYAESHGYKVVFETDSSLTYLNSDTLFVYDLKYVVTSFFTEDEIVYEGLELDLTKLYPMDVESYPLNKDILNGKSLFDLLANCPIIISSNKNKVFTSSNNDDMLGEVEMLFNFTVNYYPELEKYEPTLTLIEYNCDYDINDKGIFFKKTIYQPQYPASFSDAMQDIITDDVMRERYEEGGAFTADILIGNNGEIESINPRNIMFGLNCEINIPIYGYGEKDLLEAISESI